MSIGDLPEGAKITMTVAELKALLQGRSASQFAGIGTSEASEITGASPRKLRRLWATWDRIQRDGGRPEVRVSRKSGAGRSDLLFDSGDCYAYARKYGDMPSLPAPEPDDDPDADEVDAIVGKLLRSR